MQFGWGSMWTYDLSLVGIWKFLFKKKICRHCKAPLTLEKSMRSKKGFQNDLSGDFIYGNHHMVSYRYKCLKCSRRYNVSEI